MSGKNCKHQHAQGHHCSQKSETSDVCLVRRMSMTTGSKRNHEIQPSSGKFDQVSSRFQHVEQLRHAFSTTRTASSKISLKFAICPEAVVNSHSSVDFLLLLYCITFLRNTFRAVSTSFSFAQFRAALIMRCSIMVLCPQDRRVDSKYA